MIQNSYYKFNLFMCVSVRWCVFFRCFFFPCVCVCVCVFISVPFQFPPYSSIHSNTNISIVWLSNRSSYAHIWQRSQLHKGDHSEHRLITRGLWRISSQEDWFSRNICADILTRIPIVEVHKRLICSGSVYQRNPLSQNRSPVICSK